MIDQVVAVLTILFSLLLVIVVIIASWWLMWKLFLSRFEFINEILFPGDVQNSATRKQNNRRKPRKD